MQKAFQALDGQEIRKLLLKWVEETLEKVNHASVGFLAKGQILATVKRDLDLNELLSEATCYPQIRFTLQVELYPQKGDGKSWPWLIWFDVATPSNTPSTWRIESQARVYEGATAAPPVQIQPPKPAGPPPKPTVTASGGQPIPGEEAVTIPAEDRQADPRYAPTDHTVHGLEIDAGSKPNPFGDGNLPTSEETQDLRRQEKELAEKNARIARQTDGIVLTDEFDVDAPDAARREFGLGLKTPRQVKQSFGSRETSFQRTVDEPLPPGEIGGQPLPDEVESL